MDEKTFETRRQALKEVPYLAIEEEHYTIGFNAGRKAGFMFGAGCGLLLGFIGGVSSALQYLHLLHF